MAVRRKVYAVAVLIAVGVAAWHYVRQRDNAVRDEVFIIEAGWFTAGNTVNDSGYDWELEVSVYADPPRRIWLSSFAVDKRTADSSRISECMKAGGCQRCRSNGFSEGCHDPMQATDGVGNDVMPDFLTYEEATEYCQWRGMELPTHAQMQKIAGRVADNRAAFLQGDTDMAWLMAREWRRDAIDFSNWISPPFLMAMHHAVANGQPAPSRQNEFSQPCEYDARFVQLAKTSDARFGSERGAWAVDWSSIRSRWAAPTVVDPVILPGPFRPFPVPGDTSSGALAPAPLRKPFRCVRRSAGPPPPTVPRLPANTCQEPFREPGFEWPGFGLQSESVDAASLRRNVQRLQEREALPAK